jgi:regulatory protein
MTAVLDTLVAVRRTAMDLLARREHGRVELTRKLRQRGAPPEMIDSALDRLTEEGLLSESRYLESFVSYRARSGYGPLRIREELSQRDCSVLTSNSRYARAVSTGRDNWKIPGGASSPGIYP